MSAKAARAVLCLGSNVEPRAQFLDRAEAALVALPGTRLVASAGTDETAPVDVPPEFAHLPFLNRVIVLETTLPALELSRRMHEIEDALGRVRGPVRNAPRTVDVDLIDYDGAAVDLPGLTLPHPRAKDRDFVKEPLARLGLRVRGVNC